VFSLVLFGFMAVSMVMSCGLVQFLFLRLVVSVFVVCVVFLTK